VFDNRKHKSFALLCPRDFFLILILSSNRFLFCAQIASSDAFVSAVGRGFGLLELGGIRSRNHQCMHMSLL
jgi:hypothetical protein